MNNTRGAFKLLKRPGQSRSAKSHVARRQRRDNIIYCYYVRRKPNRLIGRFARKTRVRRVVITDRSRKVLNSLSVPSATAAKRAVRSGARTHSACRVQRPGADAGKHFGGGGKLIKKRLLPSEYSSRRIRVLNLKQPIRSFSGRRPSDNSRQRRHCTPRDNVKRSCYIIL